MSALDTRGMRSNVAPRTSGRRQRILASPTGLPNVTRSEPRDKDVVFADTTSVSVKDHELRDSSHGCSGIRGHGSGARVVVHDDGHVG